MTIKELSLVSLNPGAREGTFTEDTTATGAADGVYMIPPWAGTGIGITARATSTAVFKVQATTDTIANIVAGTAVWADLPAPFAAVASAAIAQGSVAYPVSALRLNVTTGLAGVNALIAIRTNSPRS